MFEIVAKVKIKDNRVMDLLCAAFESGSAYWAIAEGINPPSDEEWKRIAKEFNSEGKYLYLYPFGGGKVKIYDKEDENELLGVLNMDTIKRGLTYMANGKDKNDKEIPMRHWDNFMKENEDAETADVFLQLCVMGEIVFG